MPVSSTSFRLRSSGSYQLALAIFALALPCAQARAQFAYINPPGGTYNVAFGVQNGEVVGYQNFGASGFTFDGTSFTTVNVPGAAQTQVYGISGNNLFGDYQTAGGSNYAYVYDGSTLTTLPTFTGAVPNNTNATAMQGDVVGGSYEDSLGNVHGYTYDLTSQLLTTYDDPNVIGDPIVQETVITGINGQAVAGTYSNSYGNFGFIDNHGVYTTISDPLGVGYTTVNGWAGAYLVGEYVDAANYSHGFIYDDTTNTYTTIDAPDTFGGAALYGIGYDPDGGITVVGAYDGNAFEYTYTPEPGCAGMLVGLGLSGIGIAVRRSRRRAK